MSGGVGENYRRVAEKWGKNDAYFPTQRKDKHLEYLEIALAEVFATKEPLRVLDMCCGRGPVLQWLCERAPKNDYVGVDFFEPFVKEINERFAGNTHITARVGDVHKLSDQFGREFDITLMYKTLFNLTDYQSVLKQLLRVTRKKIFITSLFYEGNVDFDIKVHRYDLQDDPRDYVHYNILGVPHFEQLAKSMGARDVRWRNMELGFDLEKRVDQGFSAHTEKLANGGRLELLGSLVLDWKLVEITC